MNRSQIQVSANMNDKDYYHGGKMMPEASLDRLK